MYATHSAQQVPPFVLVMLINKALCGQKPQQALWQSLVVQTDTLVRTHL